MSKQQFLADNLNPGEVYAGLMLAENDGERDYHLIILPGDNEDAPWQTQMDWAKSIGGELPSRREQRVLFANAKSAFQATWYWSSEQSAAGYAWYQGFSYGTQYYNRKGDELRARAVRRLFI